MKHYLLLALTVFYFLQSEKATTQSISAPCGADYWHEKVLQDPGFSQKNQEYEQGILQVFKQKKTYNGVPDQAKVIPVVVHIIHDNGAEDISDAEAQQAIIWLNQALANQGNFNQGSGADAGIQLCLAQRTPEGQSTNGITRDQSALTEMLMETQDQSVKNLNRWKPKDYVNIWVVRSICSNTYGCGVYGYANYPFAHGSNIDGIVIEAEYLTQISKITGLAHEVGHYLGLYHTFEGGCTNNNCLLDGDRICDTPPDQSTAGVPCGSVISTCSTDFQSGPFTSDQSDMIWNFMDYGVIACFHDYTPDQATRMNATLEGLRKSLLASKGCLPPCPANTTAAFTASATTIVTAETITFTNTSQNANAYTWTINGIPFGNQTNATYTFQTPGTYTVLLTAQPLNGALCDPDNAQLIIQVNCAVTASFEISNIAPNQDETIFLTNTSQNTLETEWFVNGISQGASLDSIVFTAPGVYEIQLKTTNGVCLDSVAEVVYVNVACVEKTFDYKLKNPFRISGTVLKDGNLLVWVQSPDLPLLTKMTPNGEVIWSKKIDNSLWVGSFPEDFAICAALDGGFFLQLYVGYSLIDTSLTYLAKFSTNGILEWGNKILVPVSNFVASNALTTLKDGSVVSNFPSLSRFSQNGDWLWSKSHAVTIIKPFLDGGFLTLKIFSDCEISRMDVNGNLLWRKTTNSFNITDFLAMPNGDIYLTGSAPTPPFNVFQAILIKMTPAGDTVWSKKYRQIPISSGQFTQITQSPNGNIVLLGRANLDDPGPFGLQPYRIMIEVDLEGAVLWSSHYDGILETRTLEAVPSGGYLITTDPGEIIRTDQVGQTIGCPEVPHVVNVDPFQLGFDDLTLAFTDFAGSVEPATIPLIDSPLIVDTLCSPACFQSFEICNNNIDDDGDGLFDCLDPDCNCEENKCAPKQGNIWYFGDHAGIDFNTDPPSILSDGMTANLGFSASMCDQKGKLLCYTDGQTIFNRFHQPMPNGNILPTGLSVHQCMIIPHPGQTGKFFVFVNYFGGLTYYSMVDMTLDNGQGDIPPVQKNVFLASNCSSLAAVDACSFNGYWLLTRTVEQESLFKAFRIDLNGLNTGPANSNTNKAVATVFQTKISPDGKQIACVYQNSNTTLNELAVYRFDPYTSGMVSNPMVFKVFQSSDLVAGVEFSPNGRFLYVTGNFQGDSKILQFDLEAGNLQDIQSSMLLIGMIAGEYALGYPQLAPNGKIYVPVTTANTPLSYYKLSVINRPNLLGVNCLFQANALTSPGSIDFGSSLCSTISSNVVEPYIAFPYTAPDTICSLNTPIWYQIQNVQCNVDSIHWETQNLSAQILSAQIPPYYHYTYIRYLEPGAGQLIVTAYTPCGISSDTLKILVVAPLNKLLDLGPDIVVCDNGVFNFNAGSGFAKYQWSDGTADSTTTTLFPGMYWVNVWDACGNRQTDTINVSIAPNSVLDLGPDFPQQCSGFSASFHRPAKFTSWQWLPSDFLNCANCPNVTITPGTSITWVVVAQTADGCISVDTLHAIIRDTLLFSRDTFVCVGQTIKLFGTQLPADTSAQFLLPAPGAGCDTLLTINVLGVEKASSGFSVSICSNALFEYHGFLLPADTVADFRLYNVLGCDSVVTVTVNAFPPLNLSLPMDTTIRIGASVLLEAQVQGSGALDFAWSPPDGLSCFTCPDPIANPLDTITYTLAVTDINGCMAHESITLRVNEECRVLIPNAFTPNGDGSNDLFRPIMDPCVRTVLLWRILSRWGETVLTQVNVSATDLMLGWDGNWKGKAHPSDVLIWVAEFEYYDGRRETQHGAVTLLR